MTPRIHGLQWPLGPQTPGHSWLAIATAAQQEGPCRAFGHVAFPGQTWAAGMDNKVPIHFQADGANHT